MSDYGDFLKMEAYSNVRSKLIPYLQEEVERVRKAGDYSQKAMEESSFSEIIMTCTGMSMDFFITEKIGYNAFFKVPSIDNNHPMIKQSGLQDWFGAESGVILTENAGPLKGSVDLKNYRVDGIFSNIPLSVVIGHPLFSSRDFTASEITEIIVHEIGHAWDYLRLLGQIVRDSWNISNASKVVASNQDPDVKRKVLVRTKEQLGIEELDYDSLLQTADINRKDATELVLVTNSMIASSTQSKTPLYDARTVEQSADAFVAYHGGGAGLASGLVKLHKKYYHISTRSTPVYIAIELIKFWMTIVLLYSAPFATILLLISMAPSNKIYDTPEERLKVLKQNCIGALRQAVNDEDKKSINQQIANIDLCLKGVNDRRTIYEMIFDTITPVGRKRYQQEKHQQAVKELLFNEVQHKAQMWRGN